MKIVIVNGSLGGASGNTQQALQFLEGALKNIDTKITFDSWILADERDWDIDAMKKRLAGADAFVFSSGTYWDSWGSPLQKFFEVATEFEGDKCWLGKPAALVTTMHSVGGKEVLNRLHGVLNTLGLFIPPMTSFTYSFANHFALTHPELANDTFADDLWRLSDLEVVAANLLRGVQMSKFPQDLWPTWPIDHEDPKRLWIKSVSN